jgi:polysaccharide export outer membrane protein
MLVKEAKGGTLVMKESMRLFLLIITAICGLFFLVGIQPVSAAQSTADVVVDNAQKEKLRREIVGDLVLPGEQKEYVIGHGDVLSVSIYGEGDMAASPAVGGAQPTAEAGAGQRQGGGGAIVRMDGRVSLRHIGDIQVAGMTLTQAADYLKKLYLTVFEDPIVTVVLVNSQSRRYTVMGQVNSPGIFFLDFPVTIVEAIARSGGFNEWAKHDITVIRQGSGSESARAKEKKTLKFDYDDFLDGDDLEKNIYLQPNDVMIAH